MKKTLDILSLDAVRAIVDNYRRDEPDRNAAIKVADGVFIVTRYHRPKEAHSNQDSQVVGHAIYFEVQQKKGYENKYYFICMATLCSHTKDKMLKIITQLLNDNNITG